MSERAIEVLREAQRLLADLTGDNTKQSIQHLWARAVEVEVKARAALAAAERVAGEPYCPNCDCGVCERVGKARRAGALALSPGKGEGWPSEEAIARAIASTRGNGPWATWIPAAKAIRALPSPPISSRAEDS